MLSANIVPVPSKDTSEENRGNAIRTSDGRDQSDPKILGWTLDGIVSAASWWGLEPECAQVAVTCEQRPLSTELVTGIGNFGSMEAGHGASLGDGGGLHRVAR